MEDIKGIFLRDGGDKTEPAPGLDVKKTFKNMFPFPFC